MKNVIFGSLLILLLVSCRKDEDVLISTTTIHHPALIEEIVNAAVSGVVLDESGAPVSQAMVSFGSLHEMTNEAGLFVFDKTKMNKRGTFIQVEKEGYFNGSRRFFPQKNSDNHVQIKLLQKYSIGTLSSDDGGRVTSVEGIEIYFPPQSIIDANGQIYQGTFEVAARWLNPSSEDFSDIMPGNLQGISAENQEVALISFGMMAVELYTSSGEHLQLGNNQKAELTFPLSDSYLTEAPSVIPLWYFDEPSGMWIEEGKAWLQNDKYVGEVAHFSFWNCDEPYELVNLEGRMVTYIDGFLTPISNAPIKISTNNLGCGFGRTDEEGYFQGKVPLGVALDFSVRAEDKCTNDIYTTTIDPLFTDHDLGQIVVDIYNGHFVKITGSLLDCDNNTLLDGWVKITIDEVSTFHYVDVQFFEFTVFNCTGNDDVEVTGINYQSQEQGTTMSFPPADEIQVGALPTCGNVLEHYFRIIINGEEKVLFTQKVIKLPNNINSFILLPMFNPGVNEGVHMSVQQLNGPGIYNGINVPAFAFYLNPDFAGTFIRITCNNTNPPLDNLPCINVPELIIEEYTGIYGENVVAKLTGTVDAEDLQGNPLYFDLPIYIEFSLPLTTL